MAEEDPKSDWIDRVSRIAGALGMNQVRVRWKLQNWANKRERKRRAREQRSQHVHYQHKVCSACGAVQDRSARVCSSCGTKLSARWQQVVARTGLTSPALISVSTLIGTMLVLVFGKSMMINQSHDIMSIHPMTLVEQGGSFPPIVSAYHEYWRFGTAIVLHAGLWHLGFNLLALVIISPRIEEAYGRAQTLGAFVLTGLVASAVSHYFGSEGGVSIGASGAIMGLIGMAAGWGHRSGTQSGIELRNDMLKWLAYTMVFGFFIGADHAAHLGGFAAGGALGYVSNPRWMMARHRTWMRAVVAVVSFALLAAFCVFAIFPETVDMVGLPHGSQAELEAEKPLSPRDRVAYLESATEADVRAAMKTFSAHCEKFEAGDWDDNIWPSGFSPEEQFMVTALFAYAAPDTQPSGAREMLEILCGNLKARPALCKSGGVEELGSAVYGQGARWNERLSWLWQTSCAALAE
jgi:membrane associated rhomboid family serine protease